MRVSNWLKSLSRLLIRVLVVWFVRRIYRVSKTYLTIRRDNVGKKVKYSQFSRDDKNAAIKTDIELLCMARVISKVIHSHRSLEPGSELRRGYPTRGT